MLENTQAISEFLSDFGLEKSEIDIYLTLLEKGQQTTLQVAKNTNIPRTSVYRLLENLLAKGLIEETVTKEQTRLKVSDPERLTNALKQKQNQIKRLENNFLEVKNTILNFSGKIPASTKVCYYQGAEGMKQMLWNLLRTKDDFRGYSYCTPVETTGEKFAVEWAVEFNERKIKARDLYSDHYLQSIKKHPYPKSISWPTWESRYISSTLLTIDHQVDIYNNVVAFYDWHGGEVFGVEIYNPKVANLQKQMFDLIWKTTKM